MNKVYPVLIATSHVPELHVLETTGTGVRIGAAATMAEIEDFLLNIPQGINP